MKAVPFTLKGTRLEPGIMTFNLTLISSLPPTRFYILIIPFSNAIKMFKSFAFFPSRVAFDFRKIPKLNSYLGHNSKYWWKISDTKEGSGGGGWRKFLLNCAKVFPLSKGNCQVQFCFGEFSVKKKLKLLFRFDSKDLHPNRHWFISN